MQESNAQQAELEAKSALLSSPNNDAHPHVPDISPARQRAAARDQLTAGKDGSEKGETRIYLAYGSNLCAKTFRGRRKITPLSQLNVLVPDLCLTFDLPAVAYVEPCMAGTQYRDRATGQPIYPGEKTHPFRANKPWLKPLVGVAYEVSLTDYARIIATEGGGSSYIDVVVDCYPFPKGFNPEDPVPDTPDTVPFTAHTLLSPAAAEAGLGLHRDTDTKETIESEQQEIAKVRASGGALVPRPYSNYSQPSLRYKNLLVAGAREHDLPLEYRAYLDSIEPYTITSIRQRIGRLLFIMVWAPNIMLTFAFINFVRLARLGTSGDGRHPRWFAMYQRGLFKYAWISYDYFYRPLFGDGERTEDGIDETKHNGSINTAIPNGHTGEKKHMQDGPLIELVE